MCNQFNNLINTLKKDKKLETEEKYPWLDNMDERKYISDREILEKYIDLSNTCLHKEEKEEVMDMLYKYKDAFSLRGEIGTCPNIEVEMDITDKSSFLLGHITMNNLAYPLVRDTFSVLGNSRHEVLLVLDLKDAFHSLQLSEDSNRYW